MKTRQGMKTPDGALSGEGVTLIHADDSEADRGEALAAALADPGAALICSAQLLPSVVLTLPRRKGELRRV